MAYIPRKEYEAKHGPVVPASLDTKRTVTCTEPQFDNSVSKLDFDSAVQWFAVKVSINMELFVRDFLINRRHPRRGFSDTDFQNGNIDLGIFDDSRPKEENIECYVPTKFEASKLKDRVVWHEKPLVRGVIFVNVALKNRKLLFDPYLAVAYKGFFCNKATHRPQPIPFAQMEMFKAMLSLEMNVEICEEEAVVGRCVRIKSGPLAGREAKLTAIRKVVVRNEYQTDEKGQILFDIYGNPRPCEKLAVQLVLTEGLCANTEILLSEVEFLD